MISKKPLPKVLARKRFLRFCTIIELLNFIVRDSLVQDQVGPHKKVTT